MSSGKVITVQPGETIISAQPSTNELTSECDSEPSTPDRPELVLDLDRLDSMVSPRSTRKSTTNRCFTLTPNHRRGGTMIFLVVSIVVTIFIRDGRFGTDHGWALFREAIIGIIWTGWVILACTTGWRNWMDSRTETPPENLEVVSPSMSWGMY